MMEYLTSKSHKSKAPVQAVEEPEAPVLTEEDEAFLARIESEGTPPELPERPAPPLPERPQDLPVAGETEGNNAQIALLDGSQNIPLPDVPDTPEGVLTTAEPEYIHYEKDKGKEHGKRSKWSFLRRDSRDTKRKNKERTATDLMSAAEGLKAGDALHHEDGTVSDPETKKEEEEMAAVLEDLNLAAVNNRVFSVSKESQELLRKFTLVLKDLVNGVPTAYRDLESLITNSEDQIQRSYAHLPPWLQKLVEQLPSKMTKSIGPEMLAAAAEKHGLNSKYANMAGSAASKAGLKLKVPSLKDLVGKPGAVAGMLKAIMNFLKLRFPAFMGMSVLYSLALFILLFVFWYCHKRGRDVRLEKERLLTEAEVAALEAEAPTTSSSAPAVTTAPTGAPIEQVEAGMRGSQAPEQQQKGNAQYAEGGSLARDLSEKEPQKKADVEIREVSIDEPRGGSSTQQEIGQIQAWKRRKQIEQKWQGQPSKAPLDSQESCLVS